LFLSSGSPPASLKANGTRSCAANDTSCTLSRSADGSFDYGGFAQHFRSSLEAYEQFGIHPDLVSIQSNVDWLPAEDAAEACFFLPEQGTSSVTTGAGQVLRGDFPGYAEAMEAVVAATSSLPTQYSFAGPEVGELARLGDYAGSLSDIDSVAYHLYGTDPNEVARGEQPPVSISNEAAGKPSIQSAMQADGFATAILTHYALAIENSAGYLQQQFVAPTFDESSTALIGANQDGIEKLPAYHALWHFARFTDPGWVRTEAEVDSANLMVSAWASPDGTQLTVIVINHQLEPIDVEVILPAGLGKGASVFRTVFDGVERSAALGELARDGVLRLPGRAIVTVAVGTDLP
jgi:O-glycosyl hydrolase